MKRKKSRLFFGVRRGPGLGGMASSLSELGEPLRKLCVVSSELR